MLTSGVGSFVPNYKISNSAVDYIMSNIIFPTLEALEKSGTPYVGILGIDCVLTPDNQIVTLGYNSFLQEHDAQGVLEIIDENILDIIQACAIGSFADDYEKIKISDKFAVSCVLSCGKKSGEVIEGLDKLNDDTLVAHFNTKKNKYLEYETLDDRTLLITRSAKTLTRAKEDLYEEIEQIKFNGKTHRHDICRVIYK